MNLNMYIALLLHGVNYVPFGCPADHSPLEGITLNMFCHFLPLVEIIDSSHLPLRVLFFMQSLGSFGLLFKVLCTHCILKVTTNEEHVYNITS